MRMEDPLPDTSFGTWALRVIVAVAFFFTGVFNVTGLLKTDAAFGALGPPEVARVLVGLAQVAGAVLLLVPGAALIGVAVLGITTLIVVAVRHFSSHTAMELVSLFWLAMILIVARGAALPAPWREGRPFFWKIPDRVLPDRESAPPR